MYEFLNMSARQLLRAIDRDFSRRGTNFVFIGILKSALGLALMAFVFNIVVKLFASLDLMLWQGPVYWGICGAILGLFLGIAVVTDIG